MGLIHSKFPTNGQLASAGTTQWSVGIPGTSLLDELSPYLGEPSQNLRSLGIVTPITFLDTSVHKRITQISV